MISCFSQVIPGIAKIEEDTKIEEQEKKQTEDTLLQGILKTQISSIKNMETLEKKEKIQEKEEKIEEQEIPKEENKIDLAKTGLETQVITNQPLKENYNTQYGKVKIKNETEYELTNEMLEPNITIENKNIVLFHTHSCESYTSSELYPYTPTGNFRTTDLNFTVTKVGTELENQLKQYQYQVVHDVSYHDYPAYNGSYTRSLATVENILKTTPSDIFLCVDYILI